MNDKPKCRTCQINEVTNPGDECGRCKRMRKRIVKTAVKTIKKKNKKNK